MAQTESKAARLCVAEEQEPHREIHNLALSFGDQGTCLDVLGVSTKADTGALRPRIPNSGINERGKFYRGPINL